METKNESYNWFKTNGFIKLNNWKHSLSNQNNVHKTLEYVKNNTYQLNEVYKATRPQVIYLL